MTELIFLSKYVNQKIDTCPSIRCLFTDNVSSCKLVIFASNLKHMQVIFFWLGNAFFMQSMSRHFSETYCPLNLFIPGT